MFVVVCLLDASVDLRQLHIFIHIFLHCHSQRYGEAYQYIFLESLFGRSCPDYFTVRQHHNKAHKLRDEQL